MLLGQNCKGRVNSHARGRLHPGLCHGKNHLPHILVGPTEGLVKKVTLGLCAYRNLFVRNLQIPEAEKMLVKPLAIGMLV